MVNMIQLCFSMLEIFLCWNRKREGEWLTVGVSPWECQGSGTLKPGCHVNKDTGRATELSLGAWDTHTHTIQLLNGGSCFRPTKFPLLERWKCILSGRNQNSCWVQQCCYWITTTEWHCPLKVAAKTWEGFSVALAEAFGFYLLSQRYQTGSEAWNHV